MFGRRACVGGIFWLGALLALVAARPCTAQVDLLNQAQVEPGDLGEVGVRVEGVGLNNAARPGEWAGIRVRLVERGDTPREVIVRASFTDLDGDPANYEAVTTTNPSNEQPIWLYARMPFDVGSSAGFRVTVFLGEEDPSGASPVGFQPGRLLGQTTYNWPQSMPSAETGMLGVVGINPGGLSGYGQGSNQVGNPLGHEWTQVVQLRPDGIPDRWMGLAMLRELVWNGVSPSELRIEQVRALREWVERGGHLIIALPDVGQEWFAVTNQELSSMLPAVVVTRQEGEPLPSLRTLVTDEDAAKLEVPETPTTVHTFEPRADAGPGEADCILNDAQGRCIVASRSVGIGAVTLIGLPVTNRWLASRGLPEADVFWHRVLGRRGQIATEAEFNEMRTDSKGNFDPQRRTLFRYDEDIPQEIAKSGRSLAGVMLGLVVFVIYWLVAGPGGFALLKRRGWQRHAWLGFFGASIVFTALAWTGASLLRPHRVEITHLSFLDHVYGQRIQRVKSWASVLVPVYGDATVSLESDDAAAGGSRFVQCVAPWEPARSANTVLTQGTFPDARSYAIDARAPQTMTFPARATVKQVQLDWAGGVAWDSIRPVVGEGQDPFTAIKLAQGNAVLSGKLIHGLPGTLKDVRIIVFRGQTPMLGSPSRGALISSLYAWSLSSWDWDPGVALDLEAQTPAGEAVKEVRTFADLLTGVGVGGEPRPQERMKRLEWAAFFNLLDPPPPDYKTSSTNFSGPVRALREYTHGLDLSRWSTRPCLVVIATLETEGEASMPEPVRVATNGSERKPYENGTTIVRWVYPLAPAPPRVAKPDTGATRPGNDSGPAPEGGS
ncbi:MAG: hypothetical protein IPJ41_12410 [Phycisphaerales bacterium]|nr:hypothetical protein [Phycisphaerales bacterium]